MIRRYIMEIIIAIILAVIVLIIIGLMLRKKVYDKVDLYEKWKLDIMGRNVAEELSKIKQLTLEGETKKQFEQWKKDWDTILTDDLAKIEEMLYDTEQAADKFRIKKANAQFVKMDASLQVIEEKIENILKELDQLLQTEEKTREEIEELEPVLHTYKKQLTQNHYQYVKAVKRFEAMVQQLEEQFEQYHAEVSEGNYGKAATMKDEIKENLTILQTEMDQYPEVYKQCKSELPSQLDELYRGMEEMKEDGYRLEHLKLDKEIQAYQARLIDLVIELEKESVEKVTPTMVEIEERIQEMYDQLEQEALAKNYVISKMPNYEKAVTSFDSAFEETKEEVETLKQAYYFEDDDLENYRNLEKKTEQLKEKLSTFQKQLEENSAAHSNVRTELENAFEQLTQMEEDHETFKSYIQTLRKDEMEAKEKLQEMTDAIFKTNRTLKASNLPGIPTYIWNLLEEATHKNDRVLAALENEPLDMIEVKNVLNEAGDAVENVVEHTNVMLDQADLTEKVIQYANRYRSKSVNLADVLEEAESLFHHAKYEEALEVAAKGIEAVEPGALKKIEKIQEQTV